MSQANESARDLAEAMFGAFGLSPEERKEVANLADMIRTMGHMSDDYKAEWVARCGDSVRSLTTEVIEILDGHDWPGVAHDLRRFMGAALGVSFD